MRQVLTAAFVLWIAYICFVGLGPCSKDPPPWTDHGDGSFSTFLETSTPQKEVEWKMKKLLNNENY